MAAAQRPRVVLVVGWSSGEIDVGMSCAWAQGKCGAEWGGWKWPKGDKRQRRRSRPEWKEEVKYGGINGPKID